MSPRRQTAFRLTDTARELLAKIAESLGVSLNAAVEVIIREAAKKRSITLKEENKK